MKLYMLFYVSIKIELTFTKQKLSKVREKWIETQTLWKPFMQKLSAFESQVNLSNRQMET